MGPVFFAVIVLAALIGTLYGPIYPAMAAAFLYFVIPHFELGVPELPYAAAFWGLAIVRGLAAGGLSRQRAKDHLQTTTAAIFENVAKRSKAKMVDAITKSALSDHGAWKALAVNAARDNEGIIETEAPHRLVTYMKETLRTSAEEVVERTERQLPPILEDARKQAQNDAEIEKKVRQRLTALIDVSFDDARQRIVEAAEEAKIDDAEQSRIPVFRRGMTALFTNVGIWLIALWAFENFLWSVFLDGSEGQIASAKVTHCLKLFIPLTAIILAVRDDRDFRRFTFAWILGVGYLSFRVVRLWLQVGGRIDDVGGQGGEANFLAAIVVAVIPVAFSMSMVEPKRRGRWFAMFLAGVLGVSVIACGSRAGLVSIFGSAAYWLLFTSKKFRAYGFALIALAAFIAVVPDSTYERFEKVIHAKRSDFGPPPREDMSKVERQELWKLAIRIYKKHPVAGIGPNQFPKYSAKDPVTKKFTGAYSKSPGLMTHNSWLQILSEYGTIGTFLWGGAFFFSFWCFRRARQTLKRYDGHAWMGGMLLGFEAGSLGSIVMLAGNSFQWYDYVYWHMIFGPLALQIARETQRRLRWSKPEHLLTDSEREQSTVSDDGGFAGQVDLSAPTDKASVPADAKSGAKRGRKS